MMEETGSIDANNGPKLISFSLLVLNMFHNLQILQNCSE